MTNPTSIPPDDLVRQLTLANPDDENRFGFAERVVAASRDCLRLDCLTLAVGREHLGGMLADEVLPLLWGEIAPRFLAANSRRAFRRPC